MSTSNQNLSKLAFKMPRLLLMIYHAIRMIACIIPNFYCIPGYIFLNFLLLPFFVLSLKTYAMIENYLYYSLLYIVGWWSYGCGMVVHEHGDDIYRLLNDPNVKVLLVANHQSTADVPLMFQAFSSRAKWRLLWIMDQAFKWTNFGVVSQVHGDYFVNPKKYVPDSIIKHCLKSYSLIKNMIILFPEGGFRYKRLESSLRFGSQRNFPELKNVTYPRVNGYRELMNPELNITHVIDLTICYDDPDTVPSILDIVKGIHKSDIHFFYQIYPVKETENIDSEEFIYEIWQKKEALLKNHYAIIKELKHQSTTSDRDDYRKSLDDERHQRQSSKLLRKREITPPTTPEKSLTENGSPASAKGDNQMDEDKNNDKNSGSQLKFKTNDQFESLRFDPTKGGVCKLYFRQVLLYHLEYLIVTISFYCFIIWFISLF